MKPPHRHPAWPPCWPCPGLVFSPPAHGTRRLSAGAPVGPARATSLRAPAVASLPVLIDVNSADEKTLDSLPGVGPARAKAIVANRPYTDKQQLVTKKALPANVPRRHPGQGSRWST